MRKTNLSAISSLPQAANRTAVGYVRVSTHMQADDGLSLDAQTAAIKHYCAAHNLRLVGMYSDVESGGKEDRKGLADALAQKAQVFVVLKFDRLSRSIKHFCQMYEDHFSRDMELVAIREAIKLDSALGRALVSILLVFAQMEREATGERTKESISHIRAQGYHFGKVPYGSTAKAAPENPRYRILVDNPDEQETLTRIKSMVENDRGLIQIADELNADKVPPPQGAKWTKSLVYNLKRRRGWHTAKPVNVRQHTDEECKARMLELRKNGHTLQQTANILNEGGYLPYKGKKFSEHSVCKLLGGVKTLEVLTARQYCELQKANLGSPSLAQLAAVMNKSGYLTPRGNIHWWKAQISELLAGKFDGYYQAQIKRPCAAQRELAA